MVVAVVVSGTLFCLSGCINDLFVVSITDLLSLTAPEPISQTKNVGSIKAMIASRAQAKAVQNDNHVLPADSAEIDSSK